MKRLLRLVSVVLLFCTAGVAFAQVSVDPPILNRPSPFLSTWQSRASTATVLVRNVGAKRKVKIRTDFFLDGSHVANSDPSKLSSIDLATGPNLFNGEALVPMNAMHFENAVDANSQRSGRIPEGLLCLKITILDAATGAILATSPDQTGCTQIVNYAPPELILPADNSVLCRAGTNNVIYTRDGTPFPIFQWAPITPGAQTVTYHVAIFEIYPSQQPIAAIRGNRALVEQELPMQTSMLWPTQYFFPEIGKRYVWSVRALDEFGNPFIEANDGWAQPFTFSVVANCDQGGGSGGDSSIAGGGIGSGLDTTGRGGTATGSTGGSGGTGGTGGTGGPGGGLGGLNGGSTTSPLSMSLAHSTLLFYPRGGAIVPDGGAEALRSLLSGQGATEDSRSGDGTSATGFSPRILTGIAHGSDEADISITFSTPQTSSPNPTNDIVLFPPIPPVHGSALDGFVVNAHTSPFDLSVFPQNTVPSTPLLSDSRLADIETDLWHSLGTQGSQTRDLHIDPTAFTGGVQPTDGSQTMHFALGSQFANNRNVFQLESQFVGIADRLVMLGTGDGDGVLDLAAPLEKYTGHIRFDRPSASSGPITGHLSIVEPIVISGKSAMMLLVGDVVLNDNALESGMPAADMLAGNSGGAAPTQSTSTSSSALRTKILGGMLDFTIASDGYNPDGVPATVYRKHIANVKYSDISMRLFAHSSLAYDWIRGSFAKQVKRKDGALHSADFDRKTRSTREFFDALITEVGIPALDGSSKDPAYMSIQFSPERVRYKPETSADQLPPGSDSTTKKWMPANFRLNISGMEDASSRVNKIEAITIKQKVIEHSAGEQWTFVPDLGSLTITVPAPQRDAFAAWVSDRSEKSGSLDILNQEGEVLLHLDLMKVTAATLARRAPGVFRLTPEEVVLSSTP